MMTCKRMRTAVASSALMLLAGLTLFILVLAPFAAAAALRINLR